MLSNCAGCSKLFTPKPGLRLCYSCSIEEQENYQKVYGYILKRPGSSLEEVVEKTGVSREAVLKLMSQGRILPGEHIRNIECCSRCNQILSEAETKGREGNARMVCRVCAKIMACQLQGQGLDPGHTPALAPERKVVLKTSRKDSRETRRYGIGGSRR